MRAPLRGHPKNRRCATEKVREVQGKGRKAHLFSRDSIQGNRLVRHRLREEGLARGVVQGGEVREVREVGEVSQFSQFRKLRTLREAVEEAKRESRHLWIVEVVGFSPTTTFANPDRKIF